MPPFGMEALTEEEVKVVNDWILLDMPYGPETETEVDPGTDPIEPGTDPEVEPGEDVDPEDGTENPTDTETETDTEVTFEDIHPVFVKSCTGWACHQYSGFAQEDIALAYEALEEKNFANNIVDAVLDGRMPVGNFGLPLCSGDPAVDTNPKCLTQEEIDLLILWFDAYTGATTGEEPVPGEEGGLPGEPVEPAQTTFEEVHPVFEAGCSGFFCHSGGLANDNIDVAYQKIASQDLCEKILEEISTGDMPLGKDCTGDPIADAGKSGCLSQEQFELVFSWVTGDVPCAE
jgi:hypothetical protein